MISDPWIDRSWTPPPKPERVFKTDAEARLYTRLRREECRKAGKCICGPADGSVGQRGVEHGPVYREGRCERCWRVKRGLPPIAANAA